MPPSVMMFLTVLSRERLGTHRESQDGYLSSWEDCTKDSQEMRLEQMEADLEES